MKTFNRLFILAGTTLTFAIGISSAAAPYPYYQGNYNAGDSGSDNAAPTNAAPAQTPPPQDNPPADQQQPVVYRRVPAYRPVYDSPSWAMPTSAALAPWPWNFDFGGGPTAIAGSGSGLTSGSNFEIGGGYNFNPRAGFVLEFMNAWMGVDDKTLQANNAISGDAGIYAITVNPIWRFRIGGPIGGYLIGGGGYYQREQRFDEPVTYFVPTRGGGFYETDIERFRNYDDAGGVNIGAGLTWNWGWGTKFFIECRYHYIFTSGKATQIVPITFGFRW